MAQRIGVVYPQKISGFLVSSVSSLKAYLLVTKPAMVSLLVFTGVVGFSVAGGGSFPVGSFWAMLLALTFGCAGANTLTGYIDRDIDAIMERTKRRPIPSRQIPPAGALGFGLLLVALALAFSLQLNLLTMLVILAGVLNNVVIYSLWAKRRTPVNILIGSIAGGLPTIAGYTAYANGFDLRSLLLAAIVITWTPVHIWSLASHYRQDYAKAGVPMLPVLERDGQTAKIVALMTGATVLISFVPAILSLFGPAYRYGSAVLGTFMLLLSLRFMLKPTPRLAWVVFKTSNSYLGLLFLAVLIDSLSAAWSIIPHP